MHNTSPPSDSARSLPDSFAVPQHWRDAKGKSLDGAVPASADDKISRWPPLYTDSNGIAQFVVVIAIVFACANLVLAAWFWWL